MIKIILYFSLINLVISDNVIVNTSYGEILGTSLKTRYNESFYAFFGIPYAEPPIGENRFKAPIPIKPWTDIYNATKESFICYQVILNTYNNLLASNMMSEDCLRINVYTKNLNSSIKKPVFVHIHGGGFEIGSSSFNSSQPIYIMEYDIVYVTMNYRLGALGFLSTDFEEIPGNAGLKDQVLALKWIKENIEQFGGDPNLITISGHSAGGVSVVLHLVSPMSKGLFHRAIPMSGSATTQYNFVQTHLNILKQLLLFINCPHETKYETIKCLKQVSPTIFCNFQAANKKLSIFPIWFLMPVIEKDFGQERFLIEHPIKSIKNGRFEKVPLLTGISQNESAVLGFIVYRNELARNELLNNFNKVAPIYFNYESETERSFNISAVLKEKLFTDFTPIKLGNLIGEGVASFGIHRLVKLLWNQTQVYYYKSTFIGRYSRLNAYDKKLYGVEHEDDLQYILHIPDIGPVYKLSDVENEKIEQMSRLWINFAKYGNPNDYGDPFIGKINWTCYNEITDFNYLDIGESLVMKTHLFTERFKIWEKIFPLDSYSET